MISIRAIIAALLWLAFAIWLGMTAGCASLDKALENRVLCSLDKEQLAVISWYGPLGIGAKIAKQDAIVACNQGATK